MSGQRYDNKQRPLWKALQTCTSFRDVQANKFNLFVMLESWFVTSNDVAAVDVLNNRSLPIVG